MKNIVLIIFVLGFQFLNAQQTAYIEIDKILEKTPSFTEASEAIDAQVKIWDDELDQKFEAIESMYQDYVKNEASLAPEAKQQKQEVIFQAEANANAFKEEKYGMDGELNKLQEEKFKPIYENIYKVAEEVAIENNYDYLFNKSSESDWIYTNTEHDLTDMVMTRMGIKE